MPRKVSAKANSLTEASTSSLHSSQASSEGQDTLLSQRSASGSSVTLFTLDSIDGPRRSPRKRAKIEPEVQLGQVSSCGGGDIEDAGQPSSGAGFSPLFVLGDRLAGRPASEPMAAGVKTKGRKANPTIKVEREDTKELLPLEPPLSPAPLSSQDMLKGEERAPSVSTPATSLNKAKGKSKAQKPVPTTLATPHPAPENWEEVYMLIRQMRTKIVAPVDTMGCDQAQFKESDPKNRRFATLISLMLSSQTKDEVTDAAVTKLRTAIGGTLSIGNLIAADEKVIAEAINKVGFWRRKTDYLKRTALKLQSNFSSDVPKTADELCSLPGVGPKMAFLALQVCWDLNLGIGVDVHVHRITNRLGWHKRPTKTPEETRLNLQSWLPKEHHREINHMLVGFGQVRCLPVNPKCDECVLSSKELCPSARASPPKKTAAGAKKRKVEVEVEEPSEPGLVTAGFEMGGLLKIADIGVKMEEAS